MTMKPIKTILICLEVIIQIRLYTTVQCLHGGLDDWNVRHYHSSVLLVFDDSKHSNTTALRDVQERRPVS